jgi:hypothetical protein
VWQSAWEQHLQIIHEEIKSKLNLGNVCYHSVQNMSACCFSSNNVGIKVHRPLTLQVVLLPEYNDKEWASETNIK